MDREQLNCVLNAVDRFNACGGGVIKGRPRKNGRVKIMEILSSSDTFGLAIKLARSGKFRVFASISGFASGRKADQAVTEGHAVELVASDYGVTLFGDTDGFAERMSDAGFWVRAIDIKTGAITGIGKVNNIEKQGFARAGIHGDVMTTVLDENWNVVERHEDCNMVLNSGLAALPRILTGATIPVMASIQVGTDSTPVVETQTGLIALLAQDTDPIKEIISPGWSIRYYGLIAAGTSGTINERGLTIGGDGFARQIASPPVVKTENRRIAIEWTLTFTRS